MKKKSLLSIIFIIILGMTVTIFQSCDLFNDPDLQQALGLGVNGNTDDNSQIEDDIYLGTFNADNLPASVDMSAYFPPIGDQGQYGTCVAWAVGYNLRSFIDAKAGEYTSFTDATKYSPKDLFLSISDAGADCNGAFFESAFDVLVSRGVATLATVPYDNLGDCSQGSSDGEANANSHKIDSYREIDVDVATIKTYLANGKAVVFGAQLGDEFMDANSDEVLDFQTFGNVGMHAYHAMILCGYDDTKGANGAFRVVNSWGETWGDNGYIWIDQNYFITEEFCFGAYIGNGDQSDPDEDGDNEVDPDNVTSGLDLMAWQLFDVDYYDDLYPEESADERWRTAVYNVYNTGETDIAASEDWNIIYLLYNAYDGDDYQIVLFDYYSDDEGVEGENGELTSYPDVTAQGLWWNYVDVPSTWSCAKAVYGSDEPFNWTYQMPLVTGSYYLVIIADGFDQFIEYDEDNNYAYYAYEDGSPLEINNGVIVNPPLPPKSGMLKTGIPVKGQASDFPTVKTKVNANAYTTREIQAMIKHHLQTGELQQKAMKFATENKGTKTQYRVN
jgi:hypothetical protein